MLSYVQLKSNIISLQLNLSRIYKMGNFRKINFKHSLKFNLNVSLDVALKKIKIQYQSSSNNTSNNIAEKKELESLKIKVRQILIFTTEIRLSSLIIYITC